MRPWIRLTSRLLPIALLAAACNFAEDLQTNETGVARFHELYNNDQFAKIYGEATTSFKNVTTEAKVEQLLQAVKRKIGNVQSSNRQSVNVFTSTGSGTTVNSTYMTKYERGEATESFRFLIDGKKALLIAFNINSPDLVIN